MPLGCFLLKMLRKRQPPATAGFQSCRRGGGCDKPRVMEGRGAFGFACRACFTDVVRPSGGVWALIGHKPKA